MGSDLARNTYNDQRQYRRVVQQQGRVVLEADTNEAQEIANEVARQALLNMVGPSGVPQDPITGNRGSAYHISKANHKTGDFHVGAGVLYVGGVSVRQNDLKLTYGQQPEWLDGPDPPLARIETSKLTYELVYLRLREQEVSALEDPALLEPALGGPDTAQRVRLTSRVYRAPTGSYQGGSPLRHVEWMQGLVWSPGQATLSRTARLSVGFDPATNAYVGPENQMIRVQGATPATSGPGVATQLLWAYDNASSLYSAEIPDAKNPTTLKLINTPVDVAHQPRSNQYVEVLLASVDLGDDARAAAATGVVLQITRSYDPSTQTIGLQSALTGPYLGATPLFVRVWENCVNVAEAFGAPAVLIDASGNTTGLQVELSDEKSDAASVVPGDYWCVAVRVSVPTALYPARYLQPQPPEGPREWVCALATIDWKRMSVDDCRPSFGNLTNGSLTDGSTHGACCCTLTLGPEDLKEKRFHDWIADVARGDKPLTICLRPGSYELEEPIVLSKEHSHVTIEACGGRVELRAAIRALENFDHGLVHLNHADGITLRGLHFALPELSFREAVRLELSALKLGSTAARHRIFKKLDAMRLSVGLRLFGCADLRVEDCTFYFGGNSEVDEETVFGACIVATGDVIGLSVTDSVFRVDAARKKEERHPLFGYIHAPPASNMKDLLAHAAADSYGDVFRQPSLEGHAPSLGEACFHRNTFDGLTAACLILSHVGYLKISSNRVRNSYGGFWIFALGGEAFKAQAFGQDNEILTGVLRDPNVYWTLALARSFEPSSPSTERDVEPLSLGLHVHDNSVEVSSMAVVGWHTGRDDRASAIVNTNRLTSSMRDMPTGVIVRLSSTITGNILVNYSHSNALPAPAFVLNVEDRPCFWAAAGNAHEGIIHLPPERRWTE
jgi:hypothetical protein